MTLPSLEFENSVGQEFRLQVNETHSVTMTLRSFDRSESAGTRGFTMTFVVPDDAVGVGRPEQGTYLVEKPGHQVMPIFLVPVGAGADGIELQAVFTQLRTD